MNDRTRRIYLDHNAGAPLLPEARQALVDALEVAGNPSSVHAEGRRARALIEEARREVAALLGVRDPGAVVFTSGATEAANTLLTPEWIIGGDLVSLAGLAVCDTDHPCTRDGGRFAADATARLPVEASGRLSLDALDRWLDTFGPDRAAMLCLTLANSETGFLQPIDAVRRRLEGTKVLFVLDVVQAAGRLALDAEALGADALFLSGHKIGAAKGVGAFVLRDAARRPMPLLRGGGQEFSSRAGTEAVPSIASFGAAAAVARRRAVGGQRLAGLRQSLVERLRAGGARFDLLAQGSACLPNTVAFCAPGTTASTVQIALDLQGFAVSSGSACSSGKVGPSHVLAALHQGGASVDPSAGALRVSFGYETTQEDIDLFAAALLPLLLRGQARGGERRAA